MATIRKPRHREDAPRDARRSLLAAASAALVDLARPAATFAVTSALTAAVAGAHDLAPTWVAAAVTLWAAHLGQHRQPHD
jgi:hypothetical protein